MDQSNSKNYLEADHEYFLCAEEYFKKSSGSFNEKSYAFPRFIPRQSISWVTILRETA